MTKAEILEKRGDSKAAADLRAKVFAASWHYWDILAEGYAAKGGKETAIGSYTRALGMLKDSQSDLFQKKRPHHLPFGFLSPFGGGACCLCGAAFCCGACCALGGGA